MRLTRIRLRGVTRFIDAEPVSIELDGLGSGLIALVGENGSGKTTCLEAAIAALYRSFPSRPGWYDNFNGRDAFIEAAFWDAESADEIRVRINVDAEARKTEQYVMVNGRDRQHEAVTSGRAKDAAEEIERRFGSLRLLLASAFSSQGKQGNFLLLPKRDRKALMIELLGLSRLEEMHERAKARHFNTNNELLGARARLESDEAIRSEADYMAREISVSKSDVANRTHIAEDARDEEKMAANALTDARAAYEKTAGDRLLLEGARRELDAAESNIREAEAVPKRIEDELERRIELINAVDPDAMEKRARDRDEDDRNRNRERLGNETALLERVPCTVAESWLNTLADESEVNWFDLAGTCPLLAKARGAKAELESLDGSADETSETLAIELAHIADQRDRLDSDRTQAHRDADDEIRKATAKRMENFDELVLIQERFHKAEESFGVSAATEECSANEHGSSEYAESRQESAALARSSAEDDLRKAELKEAALTAKLELLRSQLADLDETRAQVKRCEQDLGDWALLARALGRDGIQALEIDASGPEVAHITNELLEACYGARFAVSFETLREKTSARGEYSEVFDVKVRDRGVERSAEALSGGERVVVGEAIGLALSIFNARKSGIRWRTLFRDETAGALDAENAQAYVDMLRKALGLGGFEQVLFVSHSETVWERADVQLFVDGGGVRIGVPHA